MTSKRLLKILYDYPSFVQTYGGVSKYICEVIKELHNEIQPDMSILLSDNAYLNELPFLKVHSLFIKKKFKGRDRLLGFINNIYSNYKLRSGSFDIFHILNPDYYPLRKINRPVVATIHDMINEKLPELRSKNLKQIENKQRLINESDKIIAVSENTKKDILEFYPVNPDKITVIHHGRPTNSIKAPLGNGFGKYLLYVGKRESYKNFNFFIKSIGQLLRQDRELKLVCVGTPFSLEENLLISQIGIENNIISIRVTDQYLYSLYHHALAFIYPSKYEGFGIPILEAFSNNCPVCLSNASCFPEIAGDAALYFDPEDENSIYTCIQKIICNPELRQQLIKLGASRLSIFSWKKAAEQTLTVYKSVANER